MPARKPPRTRPMRPTSSPPRSSAWGAVDYTTVLTAQASAAQAALSMVQARTTLLLDIANLQAGDGEIAILRVGFAAWAKIVWLASYPKSGNTWLRAFLHNYIAQPAAPQNINALTEFSAVECAAAFFHKPVSV